MTLFVGVDIGGTTTTIAIGDDTRRVICVSEQFPTRSHEGPNATIAEIVAQITAHLTEFGLAAADVGSMSIATPGPASEDGVLASSPNLHNKDWNQCPIRLMLKQAFARHAHDVPVKYIGDGQAAALGEYVIRTGQLHWDGLSPDARRTIERREADIHSLFLLAVGTGLGGGEVRDGIPIRGCKGRAGHAGHLMLPAEAFRHPHDMNLKVGNAFCTTESAISLTALTHQLGYRLTLDQWQDHPLNNQDGTVRDKAKQLRELAATGDPLALELFDDQANAMGIALLMLNYIGDYDLLVIGGGICEITEELRGRYLAVARQAYFDHALDGFRDFDGISFSVCGDSASVVGALAHNYSETT